MSIRASHQLAAAAVNIKPAKPGKRKAHAYRLLLFSIIYIHTDAHTHRFHDYYDDDD